MPAIRKLLSKYLPNILDMGSISPEDDNPFKHASAAPNMEAQFRPRSLYAISVLSMERPRKTIFTGDEGPGSPFRCSFDISAVGQAREIWEQIRLTSAPGIRCSVVKVDLLHRPVNERAMIWSRDLPSCAGFTSRFSRLAVTIV